MSIAADISFQTHRFATMAPDRNQVLGFLAMTVTVMVWAAFAVTTRSTDASTLAFGDVALIRALVPALVFLPFIPSRIATIRRAGFLACSTIAVGAGLPFFWLAVTGGAVTSAAHVSALIAGTVPVFMAALIWLMTGRMPSKQGAIALFLIFAGVLLMIGTNGAQTVLPGVAALLLASVFWTAFTIAIRRSGLDPIACAIVISYPSCGAIAALIATGAIDTTWGTYTLSQAMPYVLVQGVFVSVIAILTYAFAISRLGSSRCAAIGSLAPALTALMAILFLQETLDLAAAIAVFAICVGVYLSTLSHAKNCGPAAEW